MVKVNDATYEAWEAAARHAGVDPPLVNLFTARSHDDRHGAVYYPPGMWPVPGDNSFVFSGGLRMQLRELVDEHAIVVAEGRPRELLLLLLRHEATHVAQSIRNPAAGDVSQRLD